MDLHLTDRIALVTGSTAGIGLAIAKRLASEGAAVVLTGRTQDTLDRAAAAIVASHEGERAVAPRTVLADAGTAEGVARIIEAVLTVDILVNNLGIYEAKPFSEIADADWLSMFEVNVMSGVRLARHYFPPMLQKGEGRVIFISSEASQVIPKDMIHYAMTKTAQLTVARGLADMTRGTRVTVNTVMPGTTRSPGVETYLKSVAANPDAPLAEIERDFYRVDRPLSLIQRLIEPDEIATLVSYLASPLSAATNGAAIRADGGIIPTIA